MKLMKLLPITILAILLSMTIVTAAHIPEVLLNPNEWAANTEKDIYLSVKNNGDNIVKVELNIPVDSEENPIYTITDVGQPAGWTYQKFSKKIEWKATGEGIRTGEAVEFGFIAVSPESGEYQWNWKTTDVNGGIFPGMSTTRISAAPISYFKISGVPANAKAGSILKITVRAYGEDDKLKTDYTGTIAFSSTDPKAILPEDYKFKTSDGGVKTFSITYKTIGNQKFTVTDWSAKLMKESIITTVEAGSAISMTVTPENSQVSPGNKITFKAMGIDKYDNEFDVTEMTKWSIDKEAEGSWNANIYTAKNQGIWTVIGTYNSVVDGTTLNVKSGVAPVTPPEEEEIPEEVPEEIPEEELPPVGPTAPLEEMNIEVKESLIIAPGSNETFIATINNVGTTDLTDVSLSTMGIPSGWVTIYPFKITIEAGTSRDFLVVLSVPANETESIKMDLIASSSEGIQATKTIDINLGTAPTGFVGFSKNLLNLGIVIIAVAALVLIAWELWFRK